ncbi:hypothetical protein [Sphingomonas bacterium]|uniref:hypothetical protein n=1 Tax=Sphingomonas bacterium TaxID=1895847 RepID=UPI001576AA39|nr:hypothetical protein [Sphingomonas bacterium]
MRPISIVNFERCYLGAIVVGLVNSLLVVPAMLRTPQVAQATATLGTGFLYGSIAIGIAITLLLWYFAARRASVVAKWIIVVFFAFGVLGLVRNAMAGFPAGLSGVLSIVALVLQAVAVYLLFRPDANAWFRGGATDLRGTFE